MGPSIVMVILVGPIKKGNFSGPIKKGNRNTFFRLPEEQSFILSNVIHGANLKKKLPKENFTKFRHINQMQPGVEHSSGAIMFMKIV